MNVGCKSMRARSKTWSKKLITKIYVIQLLACCIYLGTYSNASASACPEESEVDLLLRATTIVDVRTGQLLPERDVVIDGGRICAISQSSDAAVFTADQEIDGRGRFLIPGLMEMHGHVDTPEAMTLYLANGVTTVRNLWGEPWTLALRDELEKSQGDYPRLLTAGPIVDGSPPINYPFVVVTDAREADAEVARQAAAGYDFVKIYSNMSPNVFDAMIAAGKKYNMEISGHLPHDVAFPHALNSGMRTMEHFLEVADELLRYPPSVDLDLYVVYPETQRLLEAVGRGEVSLDNIVDRGRIAEVAAHAATSDTWFDPTLMPMRNFTSDWNQMNPDWQRYLPPAIKAYWEGAWAAREGWTADARRGEDALYALRLELLGEMHKAGAHVLAGTDAPVPGMYHGFSLVDEIQQLTRAGLSNAAALRAATLEGALYLKREGELGEVVTGAEADLVLLEANPLENLQNLRSVVGVVRAGYWQDEAALSERLETIAAQYAAQEALFDGAPQFAPSRADTNEELVRTTAVKVANEPVDFLEGDGETAARLMVEETDAALDISFARRDEDGRWGVTRVSMAQESVAIVQADGTKLTLAKADGVWELREGKAVRWRLPSDGYVLPLTGTPVDIAMFAQLVRWSAMEATPLHVWHCDLAASCDGSPVAAYADVAGFEKINAVFSGADRIDVSARGLGTTQIWVGAGPFYGGQPIRMQADTKRGWERLR
ncbi:hypothetical protein NOR51B_1639 [Luminiphilus syltensis NOR5-1B]|uniref:Amidohydrolase-related domain-containing protein n=2 Tax=Luminiphilus TaxID=1341118 RepID=B8KY24_9GAMM|nr:hypothetical protein NOR51B_1639 [Luminiphilus syltensis NOR5-1B]